MRSAQFLEPDRLNVTARGKRNYSRFRSIVGAQSSFSDRVKNNLADVE